MTCLNADHGAGCCYEFPKSMKKINIPSSFEHKAYHAAASAVKDANKGPQTPQTLSHAYKLAFQDTEFLLTDEMRSVRLQLEFEKPEIIQQWHRIDSTIVMFGGSRILARDVAQERVDGVRERLNASPEDAPSRRSLPRQSTCLNGLSITMWPAIWGESSPPVAKFQESAILW